MPTYEFYREKCKKNFRATLSISEYEKKKYLWPKCKGKKVRQQISSFQTITSTKSYLIGASGRIKILGLSL